MKIFLLLVSCVLLAGCASTENKGSQEVIVAGRSSQLLDRKSSMLVKKGNNKQDALPQKQRTSTQGTFCGDNDVCDDF